MRFYFKMIFEEQFYAEHLNNQALSPKSLAIVINRRYHLRIIYYMYIQVSNINSIDSIRE